jgi:hypothetical protein
MLIGAAASMDLSPPHRPLKGYSMGRLLWDAKQAKKQVLAPFNRSRRVCMVNALIVFV